MRWDIQLGDRGLGARYVFLGIKHGVGYWSRHGHGDGDGFRCWMLDYGNMLIPPFFADRYLQKAQQDKSSWVIWSGYVGTACTTGCIYICMAGVEEYWLVRTSREYEIKIQHGLGFGLERQDAGEESCLGSRNPWMDGQCS